MDFGSITEARDLVERLPLHKKQISFDAGKPHEMT